MKLLFGGNNFNSSLDLLSQDGSTNSSPLLSSGENSFDKGKLVVRKLFIL